jgi:hypothetical protein
MAHKWFIKPWPVSDFKFGKAIVPLLGIFVGAFLGGVTKTMNQLFWGLLFCAIWLMVTMWPLSRNLAAHIVNSGRLGFLEKRKSSSVKAAALLRRRLLEHRKCFYRLIFLSLYFLCCLSVGFLFCTVLHRAYEGFLERERVEVHGGIDLIPLDDIRGLSPWIDIKNGSSNNITLKLLNCQIVSLRTNKGAMIIRDTPEGSTAGFETNLASFLLKSGDSESMPCLTSMFRTAPGAYIVCADVTWDISYSLEDQPSLPQVQSRRFVMLPGTKEWKPVATNANSHLVDCKLSEIP